ncbi:unnamed protein product [Ilex paraguariensis]|uniref:ABC transmembrane type-1 domain-containing protein n=1 Tax=Ilex paraguariensis TaxID=185542 RepID=A0ABC8RBZ7_9AQUA
MVLMYILGIQHVLDTKVVNMLSIGELLRWILSTPMQFIIGRRFYTGTYKALRQGSANMDVLIALEKNIAAYFYYVYFVLRAASSILIAFILLGKYLEVLAKGKTFEVDGTLQRVTPMFPWRHLRVTLVRCINDSIESLQATIVLGVIDSLENREIRVSRNNQPNNWCDDSCRSITIVLGALILQFDGETFSEPCSLRSLKV